MNAGALFQTPQALLTGRFLVVSYLPTCAASLFLLVLVLAGAPGGGLVFDDAWRSVSRLGTGALALVALGILVLAVIGAPAQLAMVRFLEGGWPVWLGSGPARRAQIRERGRLTDAAAITSDEPQQQEIQRAGVAGSRLKRRFPSREDLVRPTSLGNVLAAVEESAGRAYGLDAVVAWPRLYPLLAEPVRAVVDDGRNKMDAAARLSVTAALTALVSAGLLARSGWWLLLALVPAAVAAAAYLGAVQAALAYGESVHSAFDLHRFDLLNALHLPLPAERQAEISLFTSLCDEWRQGLPFTPTYHHPEP